MTDEKEYVGTLVNKILARHFKSLAELKYGGRGKIRNALEDALRDWIKKQGGDPDEPIPFFLLQEKLKVTARG